MPKNEPDPRIAKFVDKLRALDAGDKAKLKRDAGKPIAEAQNIGLFYRLLPYGLNAAQEEIYFLVATHYCLADGGGKGNLGASLHRARDPDPKKNKGLNRRVEILLDSDATQLPFRLRQAIRLLKSKNERVNWQQLLQDLLRWNYPSRIVQKQWARAYFALPKPSDEETSAANETKS
ncbi:MAG: type I-E CRISPR-associated protein Cse2/CasB [Chloroflexota bacterium]